VGNQWGYHSPGSAVTDEGPGMRSDGRFGALTDQVAKDCQRGRRKKRIATIAEAMLHRLLHLGKRQ